MHVPEARPPAAPGRILFQSIVGDVRLVVQGAGRPDDGEMAMHIDEAVSAAGAVRAVLVVGSGPDAGGPDASQRAEMARAGLLRFPMAVVSDSESVRRIVTAFCWLGATVACFPPDKLHQAFDYLQISEAVRARIPAQLAALKSELHAATRRPSSRPPPSMISVGKNRVPSDLLDAERIARFAGLQGGPNVRDPARRR